MIINVCCPESPWAVDDLTFLCPQGAALAKKSVTIGRLPVCPHQQTTIYKLRQRPNASVNYRIISL